MKENIYLIAEIGVNHDGDKSKAIMLIDQAIEAGADCVKFQTYKTDLVVSRNAPKAKYQTEVTDKDESQYAMLEKLEFKYEWFPEIIEHCKANGIDFLTTPNNFEDIDFLASLGCKEFKIASYQSTELPYLKYIAKYAEKLYISLGMATTSEALLAIETLQDFDCEIIPLQCTTNYPSKIEDSNIAFVSTLKSFCDTVGYSCHVNSDIPSILAYACGATVFEKHFTYDKLASGPDHSSSLDMHDLKSYKNTLVSASKAFGQSQRFPSKIELENMKGMKRSLFTKKNIKAGDVIDFSTIEFKRPISGGLEVNYFDKLKGKKFKKDLSDDYQIQLTDIVL